MARAAAQKKTRIVAAVLLLLIGALIVARLYLNVWALDYVNRVLSDIKGYQGSVEALDIDLYRGAYRIHELKIDKLAQGDIPTPFIDIETVDFSIQWRALFNGRIVSEAVLTKPILNFAVGRSGDTIQTGGEVDWSKPIKDLMPIDINYVKLNEGKITYQDFSTEPKVNIYMHNVNGEVRNLRNVVDQEKALPSTLDIAGNSIGGGKLSMKGGLDILKPFPDMNLDINLEGVNLPALNSYTQAYAAIDIEKGTLNLYSELVVTDGRVSGYLKPLASDVHLIDLSDEGNPIEAAWEVLVATVVEIFTNQPKDQFATKVDLEGNLNNIETDTWSALAGIVRNAFVKAFERGVEGEK